MECDNPTLSVHENDPGIPSKGDDSSGLLPEVSKTSGVELALFTEESRVNKETKEKRLDEKDDPELVRTRNKTRGGDRKVYEGTDLDITKDKQLLSETNDKTLAMANDNTQGTYKETDEGDDRVTGKDNILSQTNKKQTVTDGIIQDESRELDDDEVDEIEYELGNETDVNTQSEAAVKKLNRTQDDEQERDEHDEDICSPSHLDNKLQADKRGGDSHSDGGLASGDDIKNQHDDEFLVAPSPGRPSTANSSTDEINPDKDENVTATVDDETEIQTTSNEDNDGNSVAVETQILKQEDTEENRRPEAGKEEEALSPVLSDKSGQTDKKVTFSSHDTEGAETKLTEGARRLKQELEEMRVEEERQKMLEKEKKKAQVAKLNAELATARANRNISVDMNTDLYKKFISSELTREEATALTDELERQNQQTRQMARDIDKKHGISERRKAGSVKKILRKLETEAKQQARNDEITRELTKEEIQDLHIAFDMFDTKRRGLITISDLKRLLKMLRFPTGKGVLKDLIANLDKTKRGIAEFNDFLHLVVVGQGDGPDPYEEIVQGFNLIDTEGKGYITFEDLRTAADVTDAVFSNTMLREMMEESDATGDGRISRREFINIMLDTNRYRAIKKAMLS